MTTNTALTTKADASKAQFANAKVLLVDDNVDLLKLISIRIKPFNFDVKTATSAEEALSIMSLWRPDLIITDLQMSGLSGFDLFKQVQLQDPLIPVIILTAHGTIPDAVEAAQEGVSAYLTKPFDSKVLVAKIQSALSSSSFSLENRGDNQDQRLWPNNIITKSPLMESLLKQMKQFKDSRLIIFRGEPGTGKEQLAQAMYQLNQHANQPFEQINCISLPQNLLEIEIFGQIGNGTSAQPERMGLLQKAHNGTFIISDYHEAPMTILLRLLNALNDKSASTVDSNQPYPVDTLCIATTGNKGEYGKPSNTLWDLGEKLGMTVIDVPPLRDRREDIPLLANACLSEYTSVDNDKKNSLNQNNVDLQFSNKAMTRLLEAQWPGNARHLRSVVMQCARLTKTKVISEALVTSRINSPALQILPLSFAHQSFERDYLIEVLKVTNGNVTRAANIAKRNRTEFHRLLSKHRIEAKSFRQ